MRGLALIESHENTDRSLNNLKSSLRTKGRFPVAVSALKNFGLSAALGRNSKSLGEKKLEHIRAFFRFCSLIQDGIKTNPAKGNCSRRRRTTCEICCLPTGT